MSNWRIKNKCKEYFSLSSIMKTKTKILFNFQNCLKQDHLLNACEYYNVVVEFFGDPSDSFYTHKIKKVVCPVDGYVIYSVKP